MHAAPLVTGTTQQVELATSAVRLLEVPCPPIEEQERIVAKVDELMAWCDKLESQQQDRLKIQDTLRSSIIRTVTSAGSPQEQQTAWARLEATVNQMFNSASDVKDLKGLVLDLAVNGYLLPLDSLSHVPASGLLEQIANALDEWANNAGDQELSEARKALKKLRAQSVALPSDPLPSHWTWSTLLEVSQTVIDCHNKTAPYVKDGVHLVRTTDIRNGRMDLSKTRKISEETYEFWSRRMPPRVRDLVFTREAPMGEIAIVPEDVKICLGQRTMLIRLFPEFFSNRFLLYAIQSPSFQARMRDSAIGMTVKHLRVGDVETLAAPVPPRLEQDRIVEIVDRIFLRCDYYADQLSKKQVLAKTLANAMVESLTGIRSEAEDEERMKLPKTELIASVRLGTTPSVKAHAPLATILSRSDGEMSARDLLQRYGNDDIEAFYAQLKTEVAHGWIQEPDVAEMLEVVPATES